MAGSADLAQAASGQRTLCWFDGAWYDQPPALLSPVDHAFWMASVVFDGARVFDGLAPDLLLHCQRLVASAERLGLEPPLGALDVDALCREGARKAGHDKPLYVRPAMFARGGFFVPDATSTEFCLVLQEKPMPVPKGMRVCFSSYQRPARNAAPTDAKASCLYPNLHKAVREAAARGFDNAITSDPNGNVAELATANFWIVRDGVALTPAANGTFLAGITRARIMQLLQDDGIEAHEAVLTRADVLAADEAFTSGNYGKVMPIVQIENRTLQPGPIGQRARELYWRFAATQPV